MPENKKFSHKQLDELMELDDLTLESFEEAQAEFVTYPEDTEIELEDIVDLEEFDDIEAFDELETLDDLETETLDDLEGLDLDFEDDLVDLEEVEPGPDDSEHKRVNKLAKKDVSEAHQTLHNISRMLDTLILEDEGRVSSKEANQVFNKQKDKAHRQRDKNQVFDAEFKEIVEKTDNLDKILSKKKEKNMDDQLVSDFYQSRDWDLVLDEELFLGKTEAVLNSINNTNETLVKTQGVEKKSFSALATALLAGGGVLVFGLATAGVVTMVKNYNKTPKYKYITVTEPLVHVKPAAAPEPVPAPVEQKIIEPEPVIDKNPYRGMPPQYKHPPARPFWGIVPPPPRHDHDKNFAV